MTPERPDRDSIFCAALEIASPQERAEYVARVCGGDVALRAEVERLLDAHLAAGSFLNAAAPELASTGAFASAVPAAGPAVGVGSQIGPYKLIEAIGEGGMGTVWMAQQTEPVKRLVALKFIKAGMDSKAVLQRFEQERQALALMDHPNIARVLDAGSTADDRPYFVMELVKGAPITQHSDEHRLAPRQRLELFVQVCAAVQHAHQKGVIHRDIKPSNVLVMEYDGKPMVKVIDFGIAKAVGQPLTEKTLVTGFGAIVGTPEYMSPEQADLNKQDIDTSSDVYSLGVLLYELLTGTTPLTRKRLKEAALFEILRLVREEETPKPSTRLSESEGSSESATISAQRHTEPAKLTRLVRGELDWIVMKALEKDRTRRYETATGFALDVQRYLADEAVLACPPSVGYRLRKLVHRNRGTAVAAALVLLAVIAGGIATAWQAVSATRERDAKQQALDRLSEEQRNTQAALDQSRLLAAELAFDKGQLLGESGDADLALLWLARSLKLAPAEAVPLQAAIRTGLGAWQRQVNAVRLALPHAGSVYNVIVAPDGRLVSAGENPEETALVVRWWDPVTGKPGEPLGFPYAGAMNIFRAGAFSPDACHLLVGVNDGTDGVVRLMNLATGKSVWEAEKTHGSYATSAAFSPDGKAVVVGYCVGGEQAGGASGAVRVFGVASGKAIGKTLAHKRPVFAVAFHPDGKSFVTEGGLWANATETGEARFWDLEGREFRKPLPHPCMAQSVAFSPDGTRLLTGHPDRKARLWQLGAPQEPCVLRHEGPVLRVAFSPDGQTLLTGSSDGTVRLWGLNGRLLCQPLRHGHEVQHAAFGRDGQTVLVGAIAPDRARLWDLAAAARVGPAEAQEPIVFPLAFSPDRQTLLTLEAGHTVRLRDAATRRPVSPPLAHPHPLLMEGVARHPGQRHACSSDRTRAVTVDQDNVARLWDTRTGKPTELKLPPWQGAQPAYFTAAFSPDGKTLVTGVFQGTAYVWEAATGKLLHALTHQFPGPVFSAAFSPDGRLLLTGGADTAARFWDPVTGEALGPPLMHTSIVFALAFSPNGKTAVTAGPDPTVQLWDVTTRKTVLRLSGHQGGVNHLVFSPDGRFLLTASQDRTARLWDAASGKPIGPPLPHPTPVARVAFASDGKRLLTAGDDQVGRSWSVPAAMTGAAEHLELWAQVVTGMELEAGGGVRLLDASAWRQRRQELPTGLGVAPNP